MKRVLFTIHSMPIGGAEKVLIDILKHFDYSKYQVDLLLYYYEGDNLMNVPSDVRIYSVFGKPKSGLLQRAWHKFTRISGLINKIERFNTRKVVGKNCYDAIISFCQGPGHKMHTFLKDKSFNHISWIHNDLTIENWGKLFFDNDINKQGEAYNMMNHIVHVSNGVKDTFNQTFNISKDVDQRVIYNIVDVEDIRSKSQLPLEKPLSTNKFVFINSGRIVSQKMQSRLIEAAKILRDRGLDFEVWIMGDGPLKSTLENLVKEFSLEDKVKLIGFIKNPYPYIRRADTFVLTSSHEGFSIVVCEALALSKPVISTKVVGPIELLEDTKYGVLVDEDVNQIAEAMERMMTSSKLRQKYSEAAEKRSEMFDVDRAMNEIYSVINA